MTIDQAMNKIKDMTYDDDAIGIVKTCIMLGHEEVYSKAVDEQVGTKKAYPYFNSAQTIKKPSNEGKGYAHHAKI